MITETIYAGRDNVFSLQLVRGGEAINLLSITGYKLYFNDRVFEDQTDFTEKANGIVEIHIGEELTEDDLGRFTAYLVTFDPINTMGVRWPDFKLKVI